MGREAVALAGEEGLVVLRDGGWFVGEEGGEDGFKEGDVVSSWGGNVSLGVDEEYLSQ